MNRMLRRACATGGIVLCSLVVFTGTAHAETGVSKTDNLLNVTAAAGKTNNITITRVGDAYRVHDSGDIVTPVAPCTRVDAHTAQCSIVGIERIVVLARDGNDVVKKDVSTPASLVGDAGNDTLEAGPSVGGLGVNNLFGGDGNDILKGGPNTDILDGGAGADELNGGSGTDTADYRSRSANLRVSLDGSANDGAGGELDNVKSDVEGILSGSGNDVLTGNDDANRLVGGDGADTLTGDGGNDSLVGGNGNDTAVGGDGNDLADYGAEPDGMDVFSGGAGIDTASYSRRAHVVNVSLDGVPNDGGPGEGDNNRADVENATVGAGGDTLSGNSLGNRLDGQERNDTISGLAGDDTLIGGPGNDILNGGPGFDTCIGDSGDTKIDCEA